MSVTIQMPVQAREAIPADFETLPSYAPQAMTDILPIYRPEDSDGHIESYTLRQVASNTQSLVPRDAGLDVASYTIRAFKTGGFMNKKPHVVISRGVGGSMSDDEGQQTQALDFRNRGQSRNNPSGRRFSLLSPNVRRLSLLQTDSSRRASLSSITRPSKASSPTTSNLCKLAEARFDIMGTGTTVLYLPAPSSFPNATSRLSESPMPNTRSLTPTKKVPYEQYLDLTSSHTQRINLAIASTPHYWQPFPGNKAVLELHNTSSTLVARFIYSSERPHSGTTGAATGYQKEVDKGLIVGELQIVADEIGRTEDSPSYPGGISDAASDMDLIGRRDRAREEIICSALVVVERARRRAANIGRQGVGFRQGAACGPTMSSYGGGL